MPAPETQVIRSTIRALTFDETARALAISRRTLNAWVAAGRIRVIQLGPRIPRILESDLAEFVERQRTLRSEP